MAGKSLSVNHYKALESARIWNHRYSYTGLRIMEKDSSLEKPRRFEVLWLAQFRKSIESAKLFLQKLEEAEAIAERLTKLKMPNSRGHPVLY